MARERYAQSVVWLRRDLRLSDNAALYGACVQSRRVALAFVVDPALLAQPRMGAPLVAFFFDALSHLRESVRRRGGELFVLRGDPQVELSTLVRRLDAQALFYNEDYEPDAIARDRRVTQALEAFGVRVHAARDHVYFGAEEVARPDGGAYRMFTPYKRRWLDRRAVAPRLPLPSERALDGKLLGQIGGAGELPESHEAGFERFVLPEPASERAAAARLNEFLEERVDRYRTDRNVPALDGTSRLSPHLRAGTIGIRTCVESAFARGGGGAEAWISELIWRDFYQMIYKTFPRVAQSSFLSAGERVAWRDAPAEFERWCAGQTGYPIVDAAMRQLNAEAWMHNRLRMIAASFLTKHLLVDWRLGERYFERQLIDADAAQNNGGWQWAASTGTDAAPYFRIFNPAAQAKQFDPDDAFVQRYVPELRQGSYAAPIVDHALARQRALAAFAAAFRT